MKKMNPGSADAIRCAKILFCCVVMILGMDPAAAYTPDVSQTQMIRSDKPVIELFVMSYCPYGVQMEKGLIPVLETLSTKVDFKLKFCDYSMHGSQELQEEMNQYCISKDQPARLLPYLKCFDGGTASADCMTQTGVDMAKLNACVSSTDNTYRITANSLDKSTWKSGIFPVFPIYQNDVAKYQALGSPTLVINGKVIWPSSRDSQTLLETVCSAFNNAPAECSKTLDSSVISAGSGACGAVTDTPGNASSTIKEGAMIRVKGGIDVYIVKYAGDKKFKRLILSPSVFKSYGHLKWEDIIDVDQSVLDSYTTSSYVYVAGDRRIWKLEPMGDTGSKILAASGYDPDSVYEINAVDRDSYR